MKRVEQHARGVFSLFKARRFPTRVCHVTRTFFGRLKRAQLQEKNQRPEQGSDSCMSQVARTAHVRGCEPEKISDSDRRCRREIDDDEFVEAHGMICKGNRYADIWRSHTRAPSNRSHSFRLNKLVVLD